MHQSYLLIILLLPLLISCGENETVSASNNSTSSQKKELNQIDGGLDTLYIDTVRSEVQWVGSKTIKSHNGTIPFKSSFLVLQNDQIVGGELQLDMTKIEVLDLQGEDKARLTDKLTGEEFFKVSQFPTTIISVVASTDSVLEADLTILGKAKRISSNYSWSRDKNSVSEFTANLSIDRTNWGVIYGSGTFLDIAMDKAISDEIGIEIFLVTTKEK